MRRRDTLPAMLRGRAEALGPAGRRWLDSLDDMVAELEARWQIRAGETLSGGSHALVATAVTSDGAPRVLKIELPDGDEAAFLQGVTALRLADGRGCARLYAHDAARRATLQERLGSTLKALNYSVDRQIDILCAALREIWRIPLCDAPLPDGADSVAWFRGFIPEAWRALERPCPERVVDEALRLLDGREAALPGAERVLVHGDAHNNNLLQTLDGAGFKFVDPDGLAGERACDLGVLMREWPDAYLASPLRRGRERCRRLQALTGAPAAGIWAWGQLQMLSTSLILLQIGQTPLARKMLAIASVWAGEGVD